MAHEPEFTFQVTQRESVVFINADKVIVNNIGVMQFLVKDTQESGWPTAVVGIVIMCPDTTVFRVDALLNKEGLTTT